MFNWLSDIKYRFKYRNHNWLDTGLGAGYHDPGTVLLYANFAALKRYIDERGGVANIQEDLAEDIEEKDDGWKAQVKQQNFTEQRILDIWLWWVNELPVMETQYDVWEEELFADGYKLRFVLTDDLHVSQIEFPQVKPEWETLYKKFRDLEEKIRQDKQTMLHNLTDLRESLWT